MKTRINIRQAEPEAYKAMFALENYLKTTRLTTSQKDIIKIRASQINGCSYCIDLHTRDARKNGESEQRLYLLSAWRESDLFTIEEKAILAMTEEITFISNQLSDETYEEAAKFFDDQFLAQIIMAILTINAWNRIGVSTKMKPMTVLNVN